MDPYLLTLAGTAGTTVVTLLVGDGWQQAREGLVAVWRRFRPEAADEVERELEASRTAALQASASGDRDAGVRLQGHWIGRFAGLLGEHPEAADVLKDLLEQLKQGEDGQTISGGVRMQARSEGNSRIYQSARDQHITER